MSVVLYIYIYIYIYVDMLKKEFLLSCSPGTYPNSVTALLHSTIPIQYFVSHAFPARLWLLIREILICVAMTSALYKLKDINLR